MGQQFGSGFDSGCDGPRCPRLEIATARAVLDWIESGEADAAEPSETGTGTTVSPTALGYGQDCLATTGCSLGFFGVPYDSVLVVGEDIAPGIWNSDIETVYDDGSCHAARLRRSVTRHPEYSASAWSFWELDLLWLEQPSGNLEPHGSVIEKRSTSYVYGPQSFSIEVAPTDYALIINSECR